MTRRFACLLFAVAAVVVASSCGGTTANQGNNSGALERTSITIAIGPDPAFAVHAVAIAKGYFKDNGITNVQTKTFSSGVEAGQALIAGNIDLWNPGNLPPITLAASGSPIKVIGTDAIAHVEFLMAKKNSGINDPKDLYGKKIAVLQGSTQAAFMWNLATHYQLDMSKMKIVNLTPPEALVALRNGSVDAAVFFPPLNFQAATDLGAVLLAGRTSGFASDKGAQVDFSHTRNLFVIPSKLQSEAPNTVKAMMRALFQAQKYVADPANTDEVQQIYANFSSQPIAAVKDAWPLYVFSPALDSGYIADQKNYTDFLTSIGAFQGAAPSVNSYTDDSYVKQLAS